MLGHQRAQRGLVEMIGRYQDVFIEISAESFEMHHPSENR